MSKKPLYQETCIPESMRPEPYQPLLELKDILDKHGAKLFADLQRCLEAYASHAADIPVCGTSVKHFTDATVEEHNADCGLGTSAIHLTDEAAEEDALDSRWKRNSFRAQRSTSYDDALDRHEQVMRLKSQESLAISTDDPDTFITRVRARLLAITTSWLFEVVFGCLIVVNAILIGVEVEHAAISVRLAKDRLDGTAEPMEIAQQAFNLIFLIELVMRWFAEGPMFLCLSWWNFFDALIVLMTSAESILVESQGTGADSVLSSTHFRIFRIIRVSRLAKVVRVIRLVRFIKALRTLVYSIGLTLKSLAWAMLLLLFVLFVFAVMFTDAVTGHLIAHPGWESGSTEATLIKNFGSLPRSMLALFAAICGGLEWIDVVAALEPVSSVWSVLFVLYMSFGLFAMLNVMTGVFCQGAIEGAERDQEMLVHTVMQDRQTFMEGLQRLFAGIDDDGSGTVTIKEFERHFNDEAVGAVFRALQLDPTDAWELFAAIDTDGSGTIDAAEFLDGCMHLRGPAKAINLAGVKREIRKMRREIDDVALSLGQVMWPHVKS